MLAFRSSAIGELLKTVKEASPAVLLLHSFLGSDHVSRFICWNPLGWFCFPRQVKHKERLAIASACLALGSFAFFVILFGRRMGTKRTSPASSGGTRRRRSGCSDTFEICYIRCSAVARGYWRQVSYLDQSVDLYTRMKLIGQHTNSCSLPLH